MVMMLVTYARCVPGSVEIKHIIDGAESLKKFDAILSGPRCHRHIHWRQLMIFGLGRLCSTLRGLLEAESYLQEQP